MRRRPTDLEVARAFAFNESLRTPEPTELTTDEVMDLFDDAPESRETEIVVTFDDAAAFWTFGREAWHATFGGYDLGCTVGTGKTPLDAIVDLLDQMEA